MTALCLQFNDITILRRLFAAQIPECDSQQCRILLLCWARICAADLTILPSFTPGVFASLVQYLPQYCSLGIVYWPLLHCRSDEGDWFGVVQLILTLSYENNEDEVLYVRWLREIADPDPEARLLKLPLLSWELAEDSEDSPKYDVVFIDSISGPAYVMPDPRNNNPFFTKYVCEYNLFKAWCETVLIAILWLLLSWLFVLLLPCIPK